MKPFVKEYGNRLHGTVEIVGRDENEDGEVDMYSIAFWGPLGAEYVMFDAETLKEAAEKASSWLDTVRGHLNDTRESLKTGGR